MGNRYLPPVALRDLCMTVSTSTFVLSSILRCVIYTTDGTMCIGDYCMMRIMYYCICILGDKTLIKGFSIILPLALPCPTAASEWALPQTSPHRARQFFASLGPGCADANPLIPMYFIHSSLIRTRFAEMNTSDENNRGPKYACPQHTDAYGEKISTISNLDDYIDIYNNMDIRGDGGEEELMSDHRVTDVAQRINKTPSEDSGVEMSNGALIPRRDIGRSLGERKRSGILIRENGSTIEGVTWADDEMNFRINNEEYELRREREERLCIGPKHQKILQKRFSERLLPNREELADHIQPQRRHSHTGEINGAACVKALPKPTHIPSHHAHQQRSTHTHAHARKQYVPYDSPTARKREEYDLLPTTRVREDYSAPQARLREDYDPPPRGRDEYDPPPSRGRGEYESPSGRVMEEYDPPARVRDTREDYDPPPPIVREDFDSPVRMRDEYDPPTRPREEYDPPARVREDYEPTARGREDYESPSRVREEYDPPARVREEYDPPARVREEYDPPARVREEYDPPARVREEFEPAARVREEYESPGRGREEYDPLLSSGRMREGYELRESYNQPPASHSRDDYDPAEDAFDPGSLSNSRDEYSPTRAREVFEGSPSRTHLSVEHRPVVI
nr:uncharacterized protein LOC113813951 [Penaeus vannamei]